MKWYTLDDLMVLESGYFDGDWNDEKKLLKYKWRKKGYKYIECRRVKTDTKGLKMYMVYGLPR